MNEKKESVTIVLPLPPRVLSPNVHASSRGGMMKRSRAAKSYRNMARLAVENERIESGPWEKAKIQAVFFHDTSRRRDDVNSMQMLKPAYDGIVDAGLLVDDDNEHLYTIRPRFCTIKSCPRVEITITRCDDSTCFE